MDQKMQVLWDPKQSKKVMSTRLRPPKPETIAGLINPTESPADEQPPAAVSTIISGLRADAPEFVPMSKRAPTADLELQFQNTHISGKPSAQNRLQKIKNSQHTEQQPPQASSSSSDDTSSNDNSDMIRLKHVISSLIKYPGQFDNLLMVFMETICLYFDDFVAMSEIAQLLVSQAIKYPNFRYNGVRLCWHIEQCCAAFRAELHMKCQKQQIDNPDQQNVLLFIAELYAQLPHDNLYGILLIDSLKKLLITEGQDNIKYVCQALKLTGYSLEKNQKAALDELFQLLKESMATLPGPSSNFISSVIALRESNWGRVPSDGSASDSSSEYEQQYDDMENVVLYEMDGKPLSNEEQEFLNNHNDYIENGDNSDDDDGMDDEMQAAFEEFLKFSQQKG